MSNGTGCRPPADDMIEGKIDAGVAGVREALKNTRGFDGCIGVDVAQSLADPHDISVAERWE